MKPRVKGFQTVLGITKDSGDLRGRNLALEIEQQLNDFLEAHPTIVFRELRLAAHAAPFGEDQKANYALFAILRYEE